MIRYIRLAAKSTPLGAPSDYTDGRPAPKVLRSAFGYDTVSLRGGFEGFEGFEGIWLYGGRKVLNMPEALSDSDLIADCSQGTF